MECFKNHGFENEGFEEGIFFIFSHTPANCLQGQASPPSGREGNWPAGVGVDCFAIFSLSSLVFHSHIF